MSTIINRKYQAIEAKINDDGALIVSQESMAGDDIIVVQPEDIADFITGLLAVVAVSRKP